MNDTACGPASTVNTGWSGAGDYVIYTSAALDEQDIPTVYFNAGIVPDGVTQVNVGVAGGATVTFPVPENVYMGALPGVPDSLSFNGPNGPVTSSWAAAPPL